MSGFEYTNDCYYILAEDTSEGAAIRAELPPNLPEFKRFRQELFNLLNNKIESQNMKFSGGKVRFGRGNNWFKIPISVAEELLTKISKDPRSHSGSASKYCPYCGAPAVVGGQYCSDCGKRISSGHAAPTGEVCGHCSGSGKCGCYECRRDFMIRPDKDGCFRSWGAFYNPDAEAKELEGQEVACSVCGGTGRKK